MEPSINTLLDQLANLQTQRDVLGFQKKELIDQVLPPEIKARLEEIEAEFAGLEETVNANIAALEDQVRQLALRQGQSGKGTFLRVTYHPGRITWDTSGLDAFAKTRPEVLSFRKQGEPFVSISKV